MKGRVMWIDTLSEVQEDILLIYHPTPHSPWTDRCMYLDENFDTKKQYNHRSILKNEVVIEFDLDDPKLNYDYVMQISERLSKDFIKHVVWHSGNKSYHLHCLVDYKQASDLPLLKRVFIRHYARGLPTPDLQLCSNNHPIRAEYGIHEKTNKKKKLIKNDDEYPFVSDIPGEVWGKYVSEAKRIVSTKKTSNLNSLAAHPAIQFLTTAENMRNIGDGRERVMFILINVLGPKYVDREDEFVEFLSQWYRYSSGQKLRDRDVRLKVKQWMDGRRYTISLRKLRELFEELGLKWQW